MDFNRAQEIVNSPDHIEVLHQGKAVWITGLDSKRSVAQIQEDAQAAGNKKEVPVAELIENGVIR